MIFGVEKGSLVKKFPISNLIYCKLALVAATVYFSLNFLNGQSIIGQSVFIFADLEFPET